MEDILNTEILVKIGSDETFPTTFRPLVERRKTTPTCYFDDIFDK